MLLFLLIVLVVVVFAAPRLIGRPRNSSGLSRQSIRRWLWKRHWL
jgi:hypothetical protein